MFCDNPVDFIQIIKFIREIHSDVSLAATNRIIKYPFRLQPTECQKGSFIFR